MWTYLGNIGISIVAGLLGYYIGLKALENMRGVLGTDKAKEKIKTLPQALGLAMLLLTKFYENLADLWYTQALPGEFLIHFVGFFLGAGTFFMLFVLIMNILIIYSGKETIEVKEYKDGKYVNVTHILSKEESEEIKKNREKKKKDKEDTKSK